VGILRKRPPLKLPSPEEAAATERTIAVIQAGIEQRRFRKAGKLAKKCAASCRGRDAFGEAICSYLGALVLILKHGDQITKVQYEEARALLDHALKVLEPLERHRKVRKIAKLKRAHILLNLAHLESLVTHFDQALTAGEESLELYRENGKREDIARASEFRARLLLMKAQDEMRRRALQEPF
jgi:tetratricopeptide (TPR) repeat protein